jgi:hypothetical protein
LGCGQQVGFSVVGQHFAGLLTNLTVIIVPAARIIPAKIIIFQRLFFFFGGVQQPSLQPQSCFEMS